MYGEAAVILAELYVPLFRVSPPPLQTRISYLLPSPRTLAGMIASGLGRYLGLNPEAKIGRENVRRRLMWNIIGSNIMVTCRAGTWAYKISNTLKVWLIERHRDLLRERKKGKKKEKGEEAFPKEKLMDAMIHEYVSCDRLIVYATTNLDRFTRELNIFLRDVGRDEVDPSEVPEMLVRSMRLIDRVGDSESIATTVTASLMEISEIAEEGTLSTMAPAKWIETHDSNMNIVQDMPITPLIVEGRRRVKINKYELQEMILPLRPKFEKILYYENAPYIARAREGYRILMLENGDSVIAPERLLYGERREGRR
jgi:CRISPR-associated protein Cas5 subtype I-A